jgi:hypothetical protein
MSLWGATVITNLMSAIPWLGQDIVELKITNNYIEYSSVLPILGIVHDNARRKNTILVNREEFINIPKSFLAFLVGLIDGDGYIQITKTSKGFITMKLIISLHLEDLSTINYIHSVLKLGKINIYKDNRSPTCKLVINKTEIQEILFPLFLYHKIFFLTDTRINQFNLSLFILKNNIRNYTDIINKEIPKTFDIPKQSKDYVNLEFFRNWIVGFTMAEGSFFIKANNDACFQLKQRLHTNLFESFKLIFETDRKIEVDKSLYNQFGVSSKKDIQKVINFFSFSGLHPLVGLKNISYIKWLNSLRTNNRYKNLTFPPV